MEKTKVIITVVGKDTVGIIAEVCTYLAQEQINILDISQTIVNGYFNMMMIVDFDRALLQLEDVQKSLDQIGRDKGVQIKCQKEEIFEMMHRV